MRLIQSGDISMSSFDDTNGAIAAVVSAISDIDIGNANVSVLELGWPGMFSLVSSLFLFVNSRQTRRFSTYSQFSQIVCSLHSRVSSLLQLMHRDAPGRSHLSHFECLL